jgi:hypothetical protein
LVTIPPGINPLPAGKKLGLMAEQTFLNVIIYQPTGCPNGEGGVPECDVSLVHFIVNSSGVTPVTPLGATSNQVTIGKAASDGNVDFIDDTANHQHIVAFAPLASPASPACVEQGSRTSGYVQKFDPSTLKPTGAPVSIPLEGTRFTNGAAFDICKKIVFLSTPSTDTTILAAEFTSTGSAVTKKCFTTSGGKLLYEPYTKTLLRFSANDLDSAFIIDASGPAPVFNDNTTLTQFPANFQFLSVGVRAPYKFPLANCQ